MFVVYKSSCFITLQGFPAAMHPAGMLFTTTLPAPITDP